MVVRTYFTLSFFEERLVTDNFCYDQYVDETTGQVCWLTSLLGVKRARAKSWEGGFWSRIPLWADHSEPEDRKENANLLLAILKRRHSEEELSKIHKVLGELEEENLEDESNTVSFTDTSLLFAADEISRALILLRESYKLDEALRRFDQAAVVSGLDDAVVTAIMEFPQK